MMKSRKNRNFIPPIAESPILSPDPTREARIRLRRQELEKQAKEIKEKNQGASRNE